MAKKHTPQKIKQIKEFPFLFEFLILNFKQKKNTFLFDYVIEPDWIGSDRMEFEMTKQM